LLLQFIILLITILVPLEFRLTSLSSPIVILWSGAPLILVAKVIIGTVIKLFIYPITMVLCSEFRVTFLHAAVEFLLSGAQLSILVANTIIRTVIQLYL
jgi:hypothetical protein